MNAFEWSDAVSLADAVAQLGRPATVAKAGGVDLLDRLKEGLDAPARLVNLRTIPGLDGLTDDPARGLRIGPLVTLARLEADPLVRTRYRALADAAGHAATPQIRNMATLGGNLAQRPRCWYFRSADYRCKKKGGDACFALDGENENHALFGNGTCAAIHPSTPATALVALGAKVAITGPKGERELPVEEFFTRPEQDVKRENVLAADDLISEIRIPAPTAQARSAYHKQGAKESFDWPLADVAVVLELDAGGVCQRASVVLGAAAPIPWRAKGAEAALVGKTISAEVAAQAAKAAVQGATPLSGNKYRVQIFETVVRRTVLAAAGRV